MIQLFKQNYGTEGFHTFIKNDLPEARKVLTGIPELRDNHEGTCQGCTEGNHRRGPFPSSVTKTIVIFQLIHSDLPGMLPMTSLGGCSYYMTSPARPGYIF